VPYMTRLKEGLIRFGLGPYLEEVPGWQTRGSSSFAPACTIGHHTAGPFSGDRPSLNICVNGRADLPGPLCNDFLSRSKVILVAAGRPNHAGTGGFRGLVGNSAAFGNEAESAGRRRPDGSPDWSEFQRWAFPRVHAAHLWVLGRDASWYCGHRDWTTRKIDPTDVDTAAMRREIGALLANPQEDDMPLSDEDLTRIADRVWTRTATQGGPWAIHMLAGTDFKTGAISAAVSQLLAAGGQGAQEIAAALRPIILDAVEQGMAADNNDTADQIAARIAAKLAAPTP
jgi:hypothetical protein